MVFLSLFLLPPFFCVQFWITSLIIVFLIDKFSRKINPNWIVFAGSYISSFLVVRFAMFGPIIQSVMNGEYGGLGYMGITVFIYLSGFHLLFRNPNSVPAFSQEQKDSLAFYFHSFRIAAINGILCGIFLPLYQNHKWKLFDASDSPILFVLYILMFVFSFVVQFSLTSLLITTIVLRLKRIQYSYIVIFVLTLLSVLGGGNLFLASTGFTAISKGDYTMLIYFLITLSTYLSGYRRLFKKII